MGMRVNNKESSANVMAPQRFFRIPFVRPADQNRDGEYQKKGMTTPIFTVGIFWGTSKRSTAKIAIGSYDSVLHVCGCKTFLPIILIAIISCFTIVVIMTNGSSMM